MMIDILSRWDMSSNNYKEEINQTQDFLLRANNRDFNCNLTGDLSIFYYVNYRSYDDSSLTFNDIYFGDTQHIISFNNGGIERNG